MSKEDTINLNLTAIIVQKVNERQNHRLRHVLRMDKNKIAKSVLYGTGNRTVIQRRLIKTWATSSLAIYGVEP